MRQFVCGASASRELDRRLIEDVGVPGSSLMEVAGRGVAVVVAAAAAPGDRVLVLCGPGNNGGDGYVAARWLHAWGFALEIVASAAPVTGDGMAMARAAERSGVPISRWSGTLPPSEIVVDALLGTGAKPKLTGAIAEIVAAIGARRVVAVDLPTGVTADTGAVVGPAVTARETVTFGRFKPGMFAGEGRERCGRLHRVDLGQEAADPHGALAVAELGEPDEPPVPPPMRPSGAHKRTSGHLLVVAGTPGMAGAAILACEGALAAGVGLVTAWVPSEALPRLGWLPPEVMLVFEPPEPTRFTAIVGGPGLGRVIDADRRRWLASAWADPARPMLLDADALPLAAPAAGDRVVTPHAAEAARMLGVTAAEVEEDRFRAASELGRHRVAVLKGPRTLVAAPERTTWINPTGGPALASGGTGDVLAGVIGALLARGLTGFDAARLGVWAHGRAADDLVRGGTPEPTATVLAAAIARSLAAAR